MAVIVFHTRVFEEFSHEQADKNIKYNYMRQERTQLHIHTKTPEHGNNIRKYTELLIKSNILDLK